LLAATGIGMEPDPRLGGPAVTSGPMVLFDEAEPCSAPSPEYQAATLLLHLGVVVSTADGEVAEQEEKVLVGHLEHALGLSTAEQSRLRAHLRWLLTREPKLTGLTRRISALDETRREDIATFLTTVAAADGVIDPAEIATLKRIRKLFGLDPEQVHASLHTAAIAPVTVRPRGPSTGYSIPAPRSVPPAGTVVLLDEAALARKLAESAEVAALLESVFAEEVPPPKAAPAPRQPEVAPVADLDIAHSTLLRALAGLRTISRREWEHLAADAGVMPDGALDRINESAYEVVGEPLAEGEDPIEINQHAMGELL
jgi:tellurite resistance protein